MRERERARSRRRKRRRRRSESRERGSRDNQKPVFLRYSRAIENQENIFYSKKIDKRTLCNCYSLLISAVIG